LGIVSCSREVLSDEGAHGNRMAEAERTCALDDAEGCAVAGFLATHRGKPFARFDEKACELGTSMLARSF